LRRALEQRRLGGEDLRARRRERKPLHAIDLGKGGAPARSRRPLDLESVAHERRGIAVAEQRPRVDALAALLDDVTERDERRVVFGKGKARLLGELAARGRQRRLARIDEPLGNRPRALVLAREERPARM